MHSRTLRASGPIPKIYMCDSHCFTNYGFWLHCITAGLHVMTLLYVCVCVQMDQWVTQGGSDPLPLEEEHCSVVEVTEEDIQNSVKFVPSLSAVVREP